MSLIETLNLKPGTDNHYVLSYLISHPGWCNVIDIIRSHGSGHEVNFAARSRVSDLNKKLKPLGWLIEPRIGLNRQGEYRLCQILRDSADLSVPGCQSTNPPESIEQAQTGAVQVQPETVFDGNQSVINF